MYYNRKTGNCIFIFKLIICTVIFLCRQSLTAYAQQQAYFNNLTEKDGLSNNRVTCFFEDKTGYMWIGTESGLNLYNGNSWKVYKPSLLKKNYLSNSFITHLQQDANGSMWVCTRKGLNRIDLAAGSTEVFLPGDTAGANSIPSDLRWDAYPDSDTSIWIAADSKEFCHYNPVTKKFYKYNFREYLHNNHIEINDRYHSIFCILPKSATELWLVTTDGIFSFNKQTGAFELQAAVTLSEVTFSYFDERQKKLYFADEKNRLYFFDSSKKQVTAISLQQKIQLGKFIAPYNQGEKTFFIPAAEGVAAINEKNEVVNFLAGTTSQENDLLPGKVNCIYKDRNQITWVGTNNGVSKFIPLLNNNLHLSFPNNLSVSPHLPVKNFIYRQADDKWLIASWKDNAIFMADNKTGITNKLQKPIAYRQDTCYAFYSRNVDTIFILSVGSILTFNFRLKKWDKIVFPSPYNKTIVTNMAIDAAGNYWIVNIRKELFIYNLRSRNIWTPSKDDIGDDAISCLAADTQNKCMWIGTTGYGLIRYDFYTKKFEVIGVNNKNKTALHSSIINEITPDGKGNIWVATFEGGLAKYNTSLPPDEGFINYDILSGLPDDNVYSVALDAKDGAWFTTINGIGHIDPSGAYKGLYNQQSGLPYSKFRQSIAVLPDGKIAAVTENNFICFNPADIIASYKFPVIIDDIFVNDTVIVANDKSGNLTKFNYTQNAFTFNFSVLDFISPGAVAYYYMLEGFDKDWVFAGKQHSVRYSKLPPGSYTFKVKAKRENGGFYEQEGSFHFYIAPAFWQRLWFKIILVACLAGLIFWLIKRRIQTIRHEAELKQQIAETEMMALRAQMNPHFIFNCLNSIDNLIQVDEKEKATLYLAKFAKLIRSILENSKNNVVPCWKDMETLKLYLELEELRCDKKFSYQIKIADEIMNGDYKVPPLVIQPFVENAIHHGLLNKISPDKNLRIDVTVIKNHILYSIEDNGVGRAKAASYKQLNKPAYESMGMQITTDRINLFNQTKNGSVKIVDLMNEYNEPCGTRVEVELLNQS